MSYRIDVPRSTDLDLEANNGGIAIAGVEGRIRFDTTNGVVGRELRTTLGNGGTRIRVTTTNGGVRVRRS